MRSGLVIVALPLILGGCLPLPIAIASSTFAGISYLTSGKSTTDHVLSASIDKDCALARSVLGEPICREIGPDGEGRTPSVTVAVYPGDHGDGLSVEDRAATSRHGALDMDAIDPGPAQIAFGASFLAPPPPPPRVSIAGIVVTKDRIRPSTDARALPVSAAADWPRPVSTVVDAAWSTGTAATVTDKPLGFIPSTGADRWVVLGSFRTQARAETMVARHAGRSPTVMPVVVDGHRWHRVAVGPLTAKEARALRDELGLIDGRAPWVIRVAAATEPRQLASR